MSETIHHNPLTDLMQSTGTLLKSVGRFSLGMSLLAARQAASLVTPEKGTSGGASMDDVTRAAGQHLSGPVRTAFAVGTNVQAGVVDAAFNLAGMGPQGQRPQGNASDLAIGMTMGARRRVTGVHTVASGALERGVPQDEFVMRINGYHDESATGAVEREKTVSGLWKSEGLSTSIGKHLLPENTLRDPRLHGQVLPIAHVGLGSGSTEALVFDVERIDALFAERCAPDYREFSYEGIGAILRTYERGFFKVMTGALGLIKLDAPDGPNPSGFFADYMRRFPPDIQRQIAHGYGRVVAFSNLTIYTALSEITTYPPDRIGPAAHGAGFAFGFMNSAELPRILDHSAIPFDAHVRAAFQSGLIYALVFFDWYAPGLLDHWQPTGALETELVEHARQEAASARQRGYPLAFRLENPRT
ncbi:MAG TPA: hypothetical protein VH138_11480 [Vicinamibacterales bacterium]|nr:hypothetical protein [Vicinamibacterales bacterium]